MNRKFNPESVVAALSFKKEEALQQWADNPKLFADVIPSIHTGKKWVTPEVMILDLWREWFISINKPFVVTRYSDGVVALWKQVVIPYRIR